MNCHDEQYEKMLYAYELDLLADEDRRKFEEHFLECDACFENLKNFRAEAELLKHDLDVQRAVRQFLRNKGYPSGPKRTVSLFELIRSWKAVIPTAVAVIIFVFLILKDWQFDIKPTKEAIAIENKVLVLDFENIADPEDSLKYGKIMANLLITDLTESRFVRVVSSQRVSDILRLLGKDRTEIITADLASQIAEKARAQYILTGGILQTRPYFIVTYQLADALSGNTIAAARLDDETNDNIFLTVDRLTPKIKSELTFPAETPHEVDRRLIDITTSSEQAYRFYLAGVDDYGKFYFKNAAMNFRQAVKYDSTFSMAYYYLSILEDANLISKAIKYSERATQKEKHYINSLAATLNGDYDNAEAELRAIIEQYPDEKVAYLNLGRIKSAFEKYDSAITLFERAIDIDPLFKTPYNQLAYIYNKIGNYEKSIWAINKYIDLAPGEPNPYDTRGEIYAFNGNLDAAIESYKKSLEIKPDYYVSLNYLGIMYLFTRDYVKADSCFAILAGLSNPSIRAAARLYRTYIPLSQGKYNDALKKLDSAIVLDSLEQVFSESRALKHLAKMRSYTEKKDFKSALAEFENYSSLSKQIGNKSEIEQKHLYIRFLVDMGNINAARQEAESLRVSIEKDHQNIMHHYWYSVGYIEFSQGNFDQAAEYFAKVTETVNQQNSFFYFISRIMLGRSLMGSGRLGEAVRELELSSKAYTSYRAFWIDWSVKLHYYLGLAYEKSGWNEQAIEQFETFLLIWENADPGIEEIADARKRLARLKNQI